MTLGALIAWGAERLREAGVANERQTAALCVAGALGVDRVYTISHPERELTSDEAARCREWLARRAGREPFQQIAGSQEFWGLEFEVTPDVLIPRPETEALVEFAIREAKRRGERIVDVLAADFGRADRPAGGGDASSGRDVSSDQRTPPPRIVDVGTGSGCVAVSIALSIPDARVVAVDVSPAALAVARRNAARHRAGVAFARSYLTRSLANASVDLIVANLPYVPDADVDTLEPEVRDHEPRLALAGGPDGLDLYRELFDDAGRVLAAGGLVACEYGIGQTEAFGAIVRERGFEVLEILRDLQGIDRILVARRPTDGPGSTWDRAAHESKR